MTFKINIFTMHQLGDGLKDFEWAMIIYSSVIKDLNYILQKEWTKLFVQQH